MRSNVIMTFMIKMMMLYTVVKLLIVAVASVQCSPGGAPSGACADIAPQHYGAASQDLNSVPFALNLTALASDQYEGDQTYNRK